MCTLTWTTGPVRNGSPRTGGGYALWFNRDERRTRGPERPPRSQVTDLGVRYLAPEDSEAGGTWIAVNEFGLTVALLNGYATSRGPERASYESRGGLVRSLAGIEKAVHALGSLSPRLLSTFRPSVVFIKEPGQPALVARWDGRSVSIDMEGERQLPLTSSSYEQDEVQLARRAVYEELVHPAGDASDRRAPDPSRLRDFQAYVDPQSGPSAFTPTMSRSDAATRSQCHVQVTDAEIRFEYRPGPPHETEVTDALGLPRRPSAEGAP